MKFKINLGKETRHHAVLSCLDWSKNDEVYTIGYDISCQWPLLPTNLILFPSVVMSSTCSSGMQKRGVQHK